MNAPMTPERLAEIREMVADDFACCERHVAQDRRDLLAEVDRLQGVVEAERKNHADLTSRMGFGDGVTEPQADNDTIMRAWDEMSSQSMEWLESQSWRTDCYLAGHPDDEDCHEHDPALRLLNAEAEVDRLRARAAVVGAFVSQRAEFIQALKSSTDADADYWRWQGHAEGRRHLAERLAALAPVEQVES